MAVDRSRLPPLGPDPPFTLPEIRRQERSNGLRVWTVEHREVPLVAVLVLLPVGALVGSAERPGLAALTGDLLDEGSGIAHALEVHEALATNRRAPRDRRRPRRDIARADAARASRGPGLEMLSEHGAAAQAASSVTSIAFAICG